MGRVDVNVPELFRLWSTTISNEELARAIGIARSTLDIIRMRYGLPKRRLERRRPSELAEFNPTPEEIAERAAQIRAEWPEGEAERRMSGAMPKRWKLPSYAFQPREHSFAEIGGY